MRVALVAETFLPQVNGVVTTLCRLLEHLSERGHEALLFAPAGAPNVYAGVPVMPLVGMPLPLYPGLKLTPPQPGLTAQLRAFRPDVVHLVGPVLMGGPGLYAGRRLRLPVVSSYHTDFPAYTRHYSLGALRRAVWRYLRWLHNHCLLTLCPSRATRSDLRAQGFRRLRVWGRGVDTARFHPGMRSDAWRHAVGATDGERILLYVGRLAGEKRVELLASAMRELPDTRLVLVGDGPARMELAQRLAGTPAHFTGYLRGAELATAYASADMFVFPSDTETFGQVVQEAMASGLPVVGAAAGGTLDLVREGENALLFRPGDAVHLRAQVRALLDQPALMAAMGLAGRAMALHRSWPAVLDDLLGLYAQVSRRARTVAPQASPARP